MKANQSCLTISQAKDKLFTPNWISSSLIELYQLSVAVKLHILFKHEILSPTLIAYQWFKHKIQPPTWKSISDWKRLFVAAKLHENIATNFNSIWEHLKWERNREREQLQEWEGTPIKLSTCHLIKIYLHQKLYKWMQ